jgi:integration host factor subunit beta
MTKADLVEQVAEAIGPGITKKDCALVVDGFLNAVKRAMANGENIEIRGFGTFKVRKRKSRMARNPRTGEAVEVPSRSVPVFKPSKHLRTRVSQLDAPASPSYAPIEAEESTAQTDGQTRLGGGFDF